MTWFTYQSLLLIVLAFLLGLLVGYLWWGLRLRRVRTVESSTESALAAPAAALPVAAAAPAEIEPAESEPVALAPVEPMEPAEPVEPIETVEPVAALAEPEPAAEPTTVDDELVADVESAFAVDRADGPGDELERIEGIGPKIAAALRAAGITTFAALADADRSTVEDALEDAGLRFAPSLGTWAQQARLLADGDEAGFKALTDRLIAGRDVAARSTVDTAAPVLQPPPDEAPAATDAEPSAVEVEPAAIEVEPAAQDEPELVAEVEPAADDEPVAVVPAQAVAAEDRPVDNLQRIEGIGPKMSAALVAAGIRTYGRLAATDVDTLRAAIEAAGLRFAPSLVTWARQSQLLADGDEEGFADLTRRLVAGRDVGRV